MTVDASQAETVVLAKVNPLAVVSITCAAVGVAALVLGSVTVVAVFAVGSGHVSLQQIKARHERGATLAYMALGVSYLIAVIDLFGIISIALVG